MTDPIKSQYDEKPYDPKASSDQGSDFNPGPGDQASPELKVAWGTHPSFNLNPKDIDEGASGDPGGDKSSGDAQDFKVGYEALGAQVNEMLQRARGLVTQYEELRSKVKATEGTVFGQTSTEYDDGYHYDFAGNADGSGEWSITDPSTSPTKFAEPAKEFAAKMNPFQDAALHNIGAALEKVGEYIALVNHSGQVYAEADRQSTFPPPPPNGVRG